VSLWRSYDGFNRVTQVQHPDGSYKIIEYGYTTAPGQHCSSATYGLGYPTLVQDEVSNQRQSWVDGFGRTIEADEEVSWNNLSIATCYKYDALNNLKEVDQGSQTRTYSYDGLSRLTSSATPESGTTNLYYTTSGGSLCAAATDALCRRTDARSITTTYSYDALNRLTSKTYSSGTPTAYFY
jgi:YD repeat-containing protein